MGTREKRENQVSMTSINDYPSVAFAETQFLPASAGCYLVLNALNAILYVGKASDIRKRHENQNHHRFNDFALANAARIAFITCKVEEIDKLESSLIEQFKPTLNVAAVKSGTNTEALIDGKTPEECLERYIELAPVLKKIQAEIEALKPTVTEYVFNNGGKIVGDGWNLRTSERKIYKHSDAVFELKKELQELQEQEKKNGIAVIESTSKVLTYTQVFK